MPEVFGNIKEDGAESLFLARFTFFIGVLTVLIGCDFHRTFIYFPSPQPPVLTQNLKQYFQEVQIKTADGLSLTHWIAPNQGPWLILFHGNAGNIQDRSYKFMFLIEKGYSIFLASYRGYGGQAGRPTEKNIIQDSQLILDWLFKNKKVQASNIFIFGESLGSCVALALATQNPPFKGILMEGAPSSILDVGRKFYPFLPVKWLIVDTWDSMSRIKKSKSPLLFIHAKRDPVVSFEFGKKLYDHAPDSRRFNIWVDSQGHVDNLYREDVQEKVLQFLSTSSI